MASASEQRREAEYQQAQTRLQTILGEQQADRNSARERQLLGLIGTEAGSQFDRGISDFQRASTTPFNLQRSAEFEAETTGTPFATGSKFVLGVKRDSGSTGNVHMYKNGTLLSQASQQASPGSIAIDTLGTKSNSNFFDGIMHEVIIYDTADLTPGDITRVSNYLINNHGI